MYANRVHIVASFDDRVHTEDKKKKKLECKWKTFGEQDVETGSQVISKQGKALNKL